MTLTQEQAIILTGFTGIMVCPNFGIFHEDVEKRLGRGVQTIEFAGDTFVKQIKELYRDDFLKLIPEEK